MKVISLRQPWAYLLCAGLKGIENRTWKLPEKYKGERVLIHASAKFDIRHRNMSQLFTPEQWAYLLPDAQAYMSHGLWWISSIIGSVRLVDCVINHPSIWAEKEFLEDWASKNIPGKYSKPIYNWVVEDAILFAKPILNVKGRLNFWDYDLSEEQYLNLER